MLPVVVWKWGKAFRPAHVHAMRNMLARHLKLPHRVVCITDDPAGLDPDIQTIPLWRELRGDGYCTVRLKAFHPSMRELIGPRFAWIDLDCVLVDDVTALFARPEDFVICGVELRPQPYNGSLVLMDAGCRPQVYDSFDRGRLERERAAKRYGGSDQAWIAISLGPDEATWSEADGIFTYRDHVAGDGVPRPWHQKPLIPPTGGPLPPGARLVLLNGRRFDPLDRSLRERSPWIAEHYR